MLEAALFGAIAQSALVLGALLVWKFPQLKKPAIVGGLMAFGAGAVISAVSIDLVSISYEEAGEMPTALGIAIGCGASIPFVGEITARLGGIPALLIGVEDPACAAHAENESVHLGDLASAIAAETALFGWLATALGPPGGPS